MNDNKRARLESAGYMVGSAQDFLDKEIGVKTRVVCISDTHGQHHRMDTLPDGDILIHAGDVTLMGSEKEVYGFEDWFFSQPHPIKIYTGGNHDRFLATNPSRMTVGTSILDNGLTVSASPWTPKFARLAFEYVPSLWNWNDHLSEADILITHGPPYLTLDRESNYGQNVGCPKLRNWIKENPPRLHVFGHIHEGYGVIEREGLISVNASLVNISLDLVNDPIVIDI